MAIGCLAGLVSALGFLYLGGWLKEKIGLMDTCGVHNLHGLPGVLGAIIGSISAASSEMAFEGDTASL
jgi:ammonium transporter Rh